VNKPQRSSLTDRLLLVLALLFFLLSLLAVFEAPTYQLWKLRILITELGVWLAPLGLLFLFRLQRSRVGKLTAVLGVASAILFWSPSVRARIFERKVESREPEEQSAAGNNGSSETSPRRLNYPAADGTPIDIDFYAPLSTGRTPPLVIVLHGGSWRGGDQTEFPQLSRRLAEHGYAVASITYRLAPQHQFPAQLDDVHAAIAYFKSQADVLTFDASRIVLVGRSAGGHLALLAAYTAHDSSIRGVVSLYGPADLLWGYEHPAAPLVYDSRRTLREFIGGTPASHAHQFSLASPITHVSSAVPTLVIHGKRDELVSPEHSRRLASALRSANKQVRHLELPWATHACDYVFSGPCGRITRNEVESFIGEVTARQ
jgi:acetyl esterase/lipase